MSLCFLLLLSGFLVFILHILLTAEIELGSIIDKLRPKMSNAHAILLIESDALLRSFVLEKLAETDCDVDVACDEEEAEALTQKRQYDLVLRDLPKPFSLDFLEWRLRNSRIAWQPTPKQLSASA